MASSLETNKILAAVLTAGIFASGAGVMSRIIYSPDMPEEPSYVIDVAAEEGGGDAGGDEATVSLAALLAGADVAGGESGAKKCAACHTFDDGGDNKIGPNLYGIVGRDIASVSGFAYSDALNGAEGEWSYEALDGFLADPKGWAPGTKMAYAGMRGPEDRADLILYLRSLAADPLPLPEAEAVAEADTDAAAEGEAAAEEGDGGEDETRAPEGAAEEAAADGPVEQAVEGAADVAVDAAEAVAEEAGDAAEAVAETAAELVEGADQTATEAAGAAEDAASAAAEAASEGAAAVSEEASDAADAAADAAGAAAGGLLAMIADADVAEGEKVSKKCKACHVFEEGGKNKLGPALWGIVGRDIAASDGFNYSTALSEMDGAWTYENLDQFLAAPKEWAPGTKMVFAGVKKEQDRADLIAYLRSLAAEPAPLN